MKIPPSILAVVMLLVYGTNLFASSPKSYFMNNVYPENIKYIQMEGMMDEKQKQELYDLESSVVPKELTDDYGIPYGVIVLKGDMALQSPKSVLSISEINGLSEQTVRFFIWIKGDDITASEYQLQKVPGMTIELYDDFGNCLISRKSSFFTRGSYPWHCYYMDVHFPRFTLNANRKKADAKKNENNEVVELLLFNENDDRSDKKIQGLFITLSNFGGGQASFAGLGYSSDGISAVSRKNAFSPEYGTMAPNPSCDDLATHLYFGLDSTAKWSFLDDSHLKGLRHSDGIRDYVRKNANDWFHLQYGIAKLPYVIYCCNVLKMGPSFDDGCLSVLLEEMDALQDKNSGLWKCGGSNNLLASAAVINGIYSPKSITHGDMTAMAMPWNGATDAAKLKYADKIIQSIAGARISNAIPVWNEYAFQDKALLEKNNVVLDNADLTSTVAAMTILARAREQLSADSKEYHLATAVIREAYAFCIREFLNHQGTWKEFVVPTKENKGEKTFAEYIDIFEMTNILEPKISEKIESPSVYGNRKEGAARPQFSFKWNGKGKGICNIRIYCLPEDGDIATIADDDLIAIINKGDNSLKKADPYLMVRKIVEVAQRNHLTPVGCEDPYVVTKMERLPKSIPLGRMNIPVDAPVPQKYLVTDGPADKPTYRLEMKLKFVACGVNEFGDISQVVPVTMTDEKPAEESEEGAAPADPNAPAATGADQKPAAAPAPAP